jgi:hypothetical protein
MAEVTSREMEGLARVTSLRYEAEVQLARDGEIRSKVILVVVTMRVWG